MQHSNPLNLKSLNAHLQGDQIKIKYLGTDFTKSVEYIYKESYQTFLKDRQIDGNNWKYVLYSSLKIIKISVLYPIQNFNVIPIKTPTHFFWS